MLSLSFKIKFLFPKILNADDDDNAVLAEQLTQQQRNKTFGGGAGLDVKLTTKFRGGIEKFFPFGKRLHELENFVEIGTCYSLFCTVRTV